MLLPVWHSLCIHMGGVYYFAQTSPCGWWLEAECLALVLVELYVALVNFPNGCFNTVYNTSGIVRP